MLEAPDTREGVDTEDEGMEGVSGSNRWVWRGLGDHCGGRIWLLPYDVVPSCSTLSVCFVLNVCTGMSIFHEKAMSKLLIGHHTLLFVPVHELFILHFCILLYISLQVATALLVSGLTLTLWMPGQTQFASTSS